MKISIKKALDNWIKSLNPTVTHPLDMNRFYNLVCQCIKEGYILTYEDIADTLKEHTRLIDRKVDEKSNEFEMRAAAIIGFIKYLKEEKDIDIKSRL